MLLSSKSALREQIAGEVFSKAGGTSRQARTDERDDRRCDCLMNEHYKHCSCERTSFAAQASSFSLGGSRRRRQPRKPLVAVSGLVRG